ncbi:hypothetical protein ACOMHN_030320 [Nucella lapillus]
MATTNEKGGCSKVHLTMHVPKGRTKQMRKLFKPHLRPADPSLSLLHIHEWESPILQSDFRPRDDIPGYCVGSETLTTPALSLMTFLPEDGTLGDARERLQSFPWKFHHRIELQTPHGGCGVVSGKQEFHSLSRQYPLCSLCPSPSMEGCSVRFNLFVRNYRAMLEFYRLLADSEMESTKSDFALFTVNTSGCDFSSYTSSLRSSSSVSSLNSSSSSSTKISLSSRLSCCVQLALKHCPYLEPYPLTSAYLTFFVRNMTGLRTVLPGQAIETSPNSFIVRDPDGNCVLVHDVEPSFVPKPNTVFKTRCNRKCNTRNITEQSQPLLTLGKLSSKESSCCESQDSGRFSDSERGSSELDQCLERLVREVSLNITDYSESSETDSDQLDLDDHCPGLTNTWSESVNACGSKVKIGGLRDIQHDKKKIVYL